MNILQRIFGKKKEEPKQGPIGPAIDTVLTKHQKLKALEFYDNYKDRIDEQVKDTELAYVPSQWEDKNSPAIWKMEYWKWFLSNINS